MTPQQQMILDAFNSEIYVSNRMDVQHTPIYDTFMVPQAGTLTTLNSALFTNVGPASGKTPAQTNMGQPQKLPAPEAFSIFAFRLRWAENIWRADIDNMLNNSAALAVGFCLEFWLGQKCYQRAPLWYFSAGGGLTGYTMLAGDYIYTNGVASREAMHKLAIPIVIENQTTFFAQFVGNALLLTAAAAGGVGVTFQLLLDGLYARGVQ